MREVQWVPFAETEQECQWWEQSQGLRESILTVFTVTSEQLGFLRDTPPPNVYRMILDSFSHPTGDEDRPLPFDPDDYPVV